MAWHHGLPLRARQPGQPVGMGVPVVVVQDDRPFMGEIRAFSHDPTLPTYQPPYGWLPCDGATVQFDLSDPFWQMMQLTLIPGPRNGSLIMPDLRSRCLVGCDNVTLDGNLPLKDAPTYKAILAKSPTAVQRVPLTAGLTSRPIIKPTVVGGEETHPVTGDELPVHFHPIVSDPLHTHTITDPAHDNPLSNQVNNSPGTEYLTTAGNKGVVNTFTGSATTQITVAPPVAPVISLAAQGSGTAHNNIQPFLILDYMIYTKL